MNDLEIAQAILKDLQGSLKAQSLLKTSKLNILEDLLQGIKTILKVHNIENDAIIEDIKALLANTIFK